MGKIYLWFYCLPIAEAIVCVITASAVYIWLRRRWHSIRGTHIIDAALLICWLCIIAYTTIGKRTADGSLVTVILTPFHSYREVWNGGDPEIYRSNFMNMVLFYPAGLLGVSLLPRKWPGWCRCALAVILLACMSAGIEFLQYAYSLGRCEIDDVIHNAAGALLGSLVAMCSSRRKQRNNV